MTAALTNVVDDAVHSQVPMRQLDDSLAAFLGLPHHHEILRRFDRQGPQQHRVNGAEDRAVRTDRQSKRQDGGRGVAKRLSKMTKSLT
jgi:hypothetical protein